MAIITHFSVFCLLLTVNATDVTNGQGLMRRQASIAADGDIAADAQTTVPPACEVNQTITFVEGPDQKVFGTTGTWEECADKCKKKVYTDFRWKASGNNAYKCRCVKETSPDYQNAANVISGKVNCVIGSAPACKVNQKISFVAGTSQDFIGVKDTAQECRNDCRDQGWRDFMWYKEEYSNAGKRKKCKCVAEYPPTYQSKTNVISGQVNCLEEGETAE